ncbi:hypothetical protein [Massilia sp. Se16.2.3]|uniref:hypothetical protein n=1 Tax=Massilia sp. Se16.2.3 TaxID=2709303 RepID=UPI0016009239|nr:hypothetical protein [Massilia sp. Se16.2.3]QNB00108.1 hypothetical protein G4G31_16935 [Massilia sp. Se16.2.3]
MATAIIALTPAGAEFGSADLRLEVRQGATLMGEHRLEFNVLTLPDGPLVADPTVYMAVDPPGLLVALAARAPRPRSTSCRTTAAPRASCRCATPSTPYWRRIRAAAPAWPTAAR